MLEMNPAPTQYMSDRGEIYYVEDMETSHLINAIGHHKRQLVVLKETQHDCFHLENIAFLTKRIKNLAETILILQLELMKRNPDD